MILHENTKKIASSNSNAQLHDATDFTQSLLDFFNLNDSQLIFTQL